MENGVCMDDIYLTLMMIIIMNFQHTKKEVIYINKKMLVSRNEIVIIIPTEFENTAICIRGTIYIMQFDHSNNYVSGDCNLMDWTKMI